MNFVLYFILKFKLLVAGDGIPAPFDPVSPAWVGPETLP